MIQTVLEKLMRGENLTIDEARQTMNEIMTGSVNNSLLAGLLIALKAKGEAAEEIAGFALAMRDNSIKLEYSNENTIDVCGTGGDGSGTFNISTAVAFVVAGAGVKVAKHGNRSISSKCGSADVLKELGVNIDLSSEKSVEALNNIGITFLFAPKYHPAMKHAATVRQELGMKTIFNLLGPLTNPAGVKKQMIGVYSDNAAKLLADAAQHLGYEKVCFICSGNRYDEIILNEKTKILEYTLNGFSAKEINAETFGYPIVNPEDIIGGDSKYNAKLILRVLNNENLNGAFHTVCANAAMALYTAGYSDNLNDCKIAAEKSIRDGAALNKLNELIAFGGAVHKD